MGTLKMWAIGAAAGLMLAVPQAASAQSEYPFDSGSWVEVTGIHVDDGHGLDYAKHLAGMWRKGQDYAKAQGWISDYQVLVNSYPREGEPDVYLMTWFPAFASAEEGERRDALYRQHMAMTETQMEAASGKRADYRKIGSSMLLRQQTWRK